MNQKIRIILWVIIAGAVITLNSAGAVPPAMARESAPSPLGAITIPTQVFPSGTIPIKRIIYIWTAVPSGTKYQVQVYQGSTQKLNKVYDAAVCTSGTCSVKPGILLPNGTYIWRVRAVINGVNQPFTAWQSFVVNFPKAGFYSDFTTNATDWVIHKGSWNLESSNYFTTTGVAGKAATISHTGSYSTLAFQARMKRDGCAGCANVLAIRGNPVLDSTGWWNTEYTFDYTNNGLFSVWKDNYGTYTALKDWTYTNAINQGGWNILLVTAEGSILKFFINGALVWSGNDSAYSSGVVGIGMYRTSNSTGDKLWVDWAELSPSVVVGKYTVDEDGYEVGGGDKNVSP